MNLSAAGLPDNPNANRKRWVLPVSAVLGTALVSLGLGVVLDRRTPEQMDFVGTCSAIVLPQETTWSLPEFESLHLRGFGFSVENVDGAMVERVGDADQSTNIAVGRLELGQNPKRNSEQPSLEVNFKGSFGADSYLSAPSGALLRGADVNPRFGPTINLSWSEASNGLFNVQADQLLFPEVNRMVVTNVQLPAWTSDAETIALTPLSRGVQMMVAHFDSIRGSAEESAEADVRFPVHQQTANLYSSPSNINQDQPMKELGLRNCIDPAIKFNQRDAPDQARGIGYDIVVTGKNIDIKSLAVNAPSPASAGSPLRWVLGLRITGVADSVKVGNAELLPTELQEILSGSSARQGVLIVFFALGVLGLSVIIRISLQRILELIMPGRSPVHIDKQINVLASGEGNIVNVADFMADVTNSVNRNVESSPAPPQAKEAMGFMMEQVATLTGKNPPEVVRELGSNMKKLSEELIKQCPQKAQVDLYLRTLKDTLAGLGVAAGPSMTALKQLESVLDRLTTATVP